MEDPRSYLDLLDAKKLNDGISYLKVIVEKNGTLETKEFEIDEQEDDFYAYAYTKLKELTDRGYKIVKIESTRFWEY